LKKNITPISDSLVKLSGIIGVYYDWDDRMSNSHTRDVYGNEIRSVGVIAQDVQKVLPEAVTEIDSTHFFNKTNNDNTDGNTNGNTNGDGDMEKYYLGVKYQQLIPLLIESVKELHNQVVTTNHCNTTETVNNTTAHTNTTDTPIPIPSVTAMDDLHLYITNLEEKLNRIEETNEYLRKQFL